ncbi:MAG TPA: 3-oxoacyl-[acyl-carrier-protein] synthase III C-terminal domain-containing protein [Myxococcaceae bacterium]|nr:3-oxoacyl-[acyl-carrier-protein] synthase III C-terminal domain-containing protein [Myxococcaceae bacterium]
MSASIIGAGAFIPRRVVSNERIARALPGWSADAIFARTGIKERRFLWEFDPERGRALPPPMDDGNVYPATNVDMCEQALRKAIRMADVDARELDLLLLITSTPDEPSFCHDAMALHRRMGMRQDAFAMVIDDGGGGTPYAIDFCGKLLHAGQARTAAIVASSFVSPLLDRETYCGMVEAVPGASPLIAAFSMYVSGDGAGAVVLRGEEGGDRGVQASTAGNGYVEMVLHRGGGALRPVQDGRSDPADQAFVTDEQAVARTYPTYMSSILEDLFRARPDLRAGVKRYYFHQPTRRVVDHFLERTGLPAEKVAITVDRYGCTHAAGMLISLAEDLETGEVRLGGDDTVVFAGVGANVHFGGQVVQL